MEGLCSPRTLFYFWFWFVDSLETPRKAVGPVSPKPSGVGPQPIREGPGLRGRGRDTPQGGGACQTSCAWPGDSAHAQDGAGAHPVRVGVGSAGPRAGLLGANEHWAPPRMAQGSRQTHRASAVPAGLP